MLSLVLLCLPLAVQETGVPQRHQPVRAQCRNRAADQRKLQVAACHHWCVRYKDKRQSSGSKVCQSGELGLWVIVVLTLWLTGSTAGPRADTHTSGPAAFRPRSLLVHTASNNCSAASAYFRSRAAARCPLVNAEAGGGGQDSLW